ncbi:MAG: 3'-5' exonuclease [Pseudomonadota bacterium]|nr:3'-5' exonuclease [Pseudomonadota bacterium]
MAAPVLVFDIETVPDVAGLRLLNDIGPEVPDATVVEMSEREFQPLHLHRVVAIGCLMRTAGKFRVRCLGEPGDDERKLLQEFFDIVEKSTPQLVSWNGGGFDLQVLHYRALINRVSASRYWETGDNRQEFRWNNYLGRYHSRHLDLMDLLALYTPRASARLDDLARLCGFPGKLGMDGSQVWDAYQAGRLPEIRDYCETDIANTYLVYCRFQLFRGLWTPDEYEAEIEAFRAHLESLQGAHWPQFLSRWQVAQ